ncbi:MAG: alanine--tRNA ligase, partial [Azospira oryzae]
GALAFFGDKYGDEVRVIGMGDFSTELCGGTHVKRTGDIGLFKIVSETGVAAGIRRIEAVTADAALEHVQKQQEQLETIAGLLKTSPQDVPQRLAQIVENVRQLEKELNRFKAKLATSQSDDLAAQAVDVKGVKVVAAAIDGAGAPALREAVDRLKGKLKSAVVVLGSVEGQKVTLIAGVTSDLTGKVSAGELVNYVAGQVGGRGGGRPDLAQAGGSDPAKLPTALKGVASWVRERLYK